MISEGIFGVFIFSKTLLGGIVIVVDPIAGPFMTFDPKMVIFVNGKLTEI